MKIMVCALHGYPSPTDIYRSGFIHQRVLGYKKAGHECIVFSNSHEEKEYDYEGVKVYQRALAGFSTIYNLVRPDILFVHFIGPEYIRWMEENNIPIPQVVWIHGFEALSWRRRLFNFSLSKAFMRFILENTMNRRIWYNSLKSRMNIWEKVSFVFVSEWMKEIAQRDIGYHFNKSNIIPNPINHELFRFTDYDESKRLKVLMIRSFASKKYATDVAINAINILSKSKDFNQFKFSIYGKGVLFDKQTSSIKDFTNVSLHNYYVEQKDIPNIHRDHGILLCPSRQDSQGVTMCEGMSSGLTVIASNNTAIPEFMPDNCGYKANTAHEVARTLEHIASHPEEAKIFAKQGSSYIQKKCHYDRIIEKELKIAMQVLERS